MMLVATKFQFHDFIHPSLCLSFLLTLIKMSYRIYMCTMISYILYLNHFMNTLHNASKYNIEMCHDMHFFIKGMFTEGMHLITIQFAT
jgi:hypothetical protein